MTVYSIQHPLYTNLLLQKSGQINKTEEKELANNNSQNIKDIDNYQSGNYKINQYRDSYQITAKYSSGKLKNDDYTQAIDLFA